MDLQLLCVGADGHIGFNEPLSALKSRTRVKALAPVTLEQNGEFFGGPDKMPRRAITMGVGTILDLLTAQSALASARAQQAQTRWTWATSLAQLSHDVGVLGVHGETPIPLTHDTTTGPK